MYKHDIEEIDSEKKYFLEELVSEYKKEAYAHDYGGLLEETFSKVLLESSEISYLYEAFYLPYDDFKIIIDKHDENDKSVINELKDKYLKNHNIYTDNGKYSDEIVIRRINDIKEIEEYKKEFVVNKVLKI